MSAIPVEMKALINEFLAAQQEQAAKKAAEKKQSSKVEAVEKAATRPMRPKEVIRYATTFGFVVGQGGRHGVHLVAPNGSECPLPMHGGGKTIANGTLRSILSFIHQNGTTLAATG